MTSHVAPKVAVVVGSLAKDSINRKFAEAVAKLARGRLDLQIVEIKDLPLYSYDYDAAYPEPALRFKREIAAADAVLFVTPEYLRSIPAALKNAIEWGSRPYGTSVWTGKPAAMIGTTPGAIGTAVAQAELRSIANVLELALITQPEVYFQWKPDTLNGAGEIADEGARKVLNGWVDSFAAWIQRVRQPAILAQAS
ncbi:MAG: NADPH-dependent FMN reductase [Hyphomonadaceae bacterium]